MMEQQIATGFKDVSVKATARINERDEYSPAGLPLTVWLNIKEVLNLTGLANRQALYAWIASGLFPPPCKIGNRDVWRAEDYQKWSDERPAATELIGDSGDAA